MNGRRRYFKTGIRLKPAEWDKRKNEVKGNPSYNTLIRDRIRELETFELRFPAIFGRPFTLDDFDSSTDNQSSSDSKAPALTFTEFVIRQCEQDKHKVSEDTTQRYLRTNEYLKLYNKDVPVQFKDITYDFVEGFESWLRASGRAKEKSTIYKHHKGIKKYLSLATRKGLFDANTNPYLNFAIKNGESIIDVVQPNEIRRLEQLDLTGENSRYAIYRDAYLFGYYTLLRISDITRLRQSHLIETERGLCIDLKAKKTGKHNWIPLYELHLDENGQSKPVQLIKRYTRDDQKPLFGRTDQVINRNLKVLFRMARINKPAYFHTARHSGITFLLEIGIPMHVVQRLAQHSKPQMTMKYVHLTNHDVVKILSRTEWNTGSNAKSPQTSKTLPKDL